MAHDRRAGSDLFSGHRACVCVGTGRSRDLDRIVSCAQKGADSDMK